MAKFVVFYHFDREHSLRHTVEAETLSDARARVFESVRDNGLMRTIEFRVEDNLFVVPLESIRFLQIVDAERDVESHQWNLSG